MAKENVEEFLASGGKITTLPYRGRPQPVKGEEKDVTASYWANKRPAGDGCFDTFGWENRYGAE